MRWRTQRKIHGSGPASESNHSNPIQSEQLKKTTTTNSFLKHRGSSDSSSLFVPLSVLIFPRRAHHPFQSVDCSLDDPSIPVLSDSCDKMAMNLPIEMVELILDNLCYNHKKGPREYYPYWHDDESKDFPPVDAVEAQSCLSALAHLRQSSRLLHDLATWRLFHTLTETTVRTRWWLVARTLLMRPDLAQLVKHLSLSSASAAPSLPEEVKAYFHEQVAAVVPGRWKCDSDLYGVPWDEDLITPADLYDAEGTNVSFAILIRLCCNLETLDFVARSSVKPLSFCHPGSLLSLHSIYVHWEVFGLMFDIFTLRRLLGAAPNLRLVHCRGAFRCFDIGEVAELVHLQQVTVVQMTKCALGYEDLVALFRLCPNLKTFRYCGVTSMNSDHFTPAEAAQAICKYVPNLECFELDLTDWDLFIEHFTDDDLLEAKGRLEEMGIMCNFVKGFQDMTPSFY